MAVTINKTATSHQRAKAKKKRLIVVKKERFRKRKEAMKLTAAADKTAVSAKHSFRYAGRASKAAITAALKKSVPATPAAIYRAGIQASEEAMQTMGYTIVAEAGWLLQKNADGSTQQLQKI